MPVWRKHADGRTAYALVVTRLGRKTLGADAAKPARSPRSGKASMVADATATGSKREPRAGTKEALLVKLLSRKGGASIDELTAATNWLPHTARAALTGLRRRGYRIERSENAECQSVYRIVAAEAVLRRP